MQNHVFGGFDSALLNGDGGPRRRPRLEDFSLSDVTSIRNLLRGGSVIDWKRLYFADRAEVERFLRAQEFDLHDAFDIDRLEMLRARAVEYLERHLGFHIPDEVAESLPAQDLLLVASQKGKRRNYACVVLKAMHVMHHLSGRELLTKLPISADQLFGLVEDKVLRTVEDIKSAGCALSEFEWSRKHADSLITKLLAKKENIAASVYDRIRFRMVTNNKDDLLLLLREICQRLVPYNYVVPGESINAVLPFRTTIETSPVLSKFLPELTDLAQQAGDRRPLEQNEFSGPSYAVINFVVDLPIRIDSFLNRPPSDPMFQEHGRIVFVLTEFQVLDMKTAEQNEHGENSHDCYKERQSTKVKARLMHGMKEDAVE